MIKYCFVKLEINLKTPCTALLKKSIRHLFFICENLVDFYEARLHETSLNLHRHMWIFSRLSIAPVDGKHHLSELVFSALVGFSLQGKWWKNWSSALDSDLFLRKIRLLWFARLLTLLISVGTYRRCRRSEERPTETNTTNWMGRRLSLKV